MAFELTNHGPLPLTAASQIGYGEAVQLAASGPERAIIPIATVNVEPFGISFASAAGTYIGAASGGFQLTQACPVIDAGNIVKVPAIASLGQGADIGVASTNGGLAPVAAASGVDVWSVGKALSAAAANGEYFSLYVRPRKLSGTVR